MWLPLADYVFVVITDLRISNKNTSTIKFVVCGRRKNLHILVANIHKIVGQNVYILTEDETFYAIKHILCNLDQHKFALNIFRYKTIVKNYSDLIF
jgi:hypothetical protein